MYEYNGNEVQAYYFNKVVFNTYLTDQERHIINILDYYRYDTMEHTKDYPHISWITFNVSNWECTNMHIRLYLIIQDCKKHTYELYAEDHKDNPTKAMLDLQLTLKDITPKMFFDDVIKIILKCATLMDGSNPLRTKIENGDTSEFIDTLNEICAPMLSALKKGNHTEQTEKAISIISRKAQTIMDYAKKRVISE